MKAKRHILTILIFIISFNILGLGNSYAEEHKLENLDIKVFINEDGSAIIRQRRVANLIEGTENYIVIENLGKSEIIDFKVIENEREYQFIEPWDLDASREEKTFKNGIIKTDDGYELSWGIGEYGRHEYFLEYTVTNFIKELEDSQILFWRFANDQTNIPPEKVRLSIQSKYNFNEENQKIWGFGFEGQLGFNNGMILAESTEPLSKDNYVTVLVKFEKGMFDTEDYIMSSFEDIKEKAFEGSDYGKGNMSSGGSSSPYMDIIQIIVVALIGISFFGRFKKSSKYKAKKFSRKFKEEYYRDYPYEGNILDIYYILYTMGASNFENLLTGFILKWINEDKVVASSKEVGWIRKKEQTVIKFLDKDMPRDTLEGELFYIMLYAAGENQTLEEKEFSKWAKSNVNVIDSWEEDIRNKSLIKLQELGYIIVEEKKKFLFKTQDYKLTEKGQEMEEKIYKYINYLYDFSLLNEHEAVNVKIWDNIMIWAAFLGLTNVVREQFEKIYPRYVEETVYRGNSIYLSHSLTKSVSQARNAARSSGSGGSTSVGGGGGSFGGGSGGGTR